MWTLRAPLFLALLLLQSPLQDAVSLVRQARYAEARAALTNTKEPTEPRQRVAFHRLKAAIASGLREPATAAEEMKAALALAPNDPALCLATAVAEDQAGNTSSALVLYRRAVTLNPAEERPWALLAFTLIEHALTDEAISTLDAARRHFAKSATLLTLAGVAIYAKGEAKDAEAMLNRAIGEDSNFQPAYKSLTRIVLESSAVPSPDTLRSLCAWDPIVCGALQLRVARETGNRSMERGAMDVLSRAPARNAIAQCALGQAYSWNNHLASAREHLERCVALDSSPQNHYRLAMIYQRLGANDLARSELEARKKLLGRQSEEAVTGRDALRQMKP